MTKGLFAKEMFKNISNKSKIQINKLFVTVDCKSRTVREKRTQWVGPSPRGPQATLTPIAGELEALCFLPAVYGTESGQKQTGNSIQFSITIITRSIFRHSTEHFTTKFF